MPLGIFGGSGSNGPKPQPLTSEKKEKRDKGSGSGTGLLDIKDSKGTTIKLGKKSYTVEKKLAEGGFALVYLVCDKHNRNYALKRQLIRDDPRQIEACRTESQIVKNLNGHKNIVAYVNHQLAMNKVGIYDYMLLTVYYPTNVLQLMNSRLLSNRWLNEIEILDIFCDVCEAVARLHHSKTPVIHRDLKVENVLIDQRTGNEKPVYVLCDFGSATTKILSKETHNQAYMEEEIRRYTTLSYRAPEMIDLFSGVPISTKSDIWALGVLLYKICYFSLPFGESALAIQNGSFTFPDQPTISEEIKSIINLLLTSSARHRPNIFQTSYLAFAAANRKCPIYNIERSPRIELTEAVQILRLRAKLGANYSRLFEKAFNDFENAKKYPQPENTTTTAATELPPNETANCTTDGGNDHQQPQSSSALAPNRNGNENLVFFDSPPVEGVIVSTLSAPPPRSSTTSIHPRLRPRPTPHGVLSSPFGVVPPTSARNSSTTTPTPMAAAVPITTTQLQSSQVASTVAPTNMVADSTVATIAHPAPAADTRALSGPVVVDNSKNSDEVAMQQCDGTAPTGSSVAVSVSHSNSSDNNSKSSTATTMAGGGSGNSNPQISSSCLKSSAFKPYSMIAGKQRQRKLSRTTPTSMEQTCDTNADYTPQNGETVAAIPFESSNPFISASASGGFTFVSGSPPTMDDNVFGERFDELRRVNRRNTIEATTMSFSTTPSRLRSEENPPKSGLESSAAPNPAFVAASSSHSTKSSSYQRYDDNVHLPAGVAQPQQHHQLQQDAFLLAHKQRFVAHSSTPPKPLDMEWLERAIDEDPFGQAPPIPQHQLSMLALVNKSKT